MPKLSNSDRRAKVSANEANRRRLVALAKLRELQLGAYEGKLLNRDEVRSAVSAMIGAAKNRLIVIADELCDELAATWDPVRCRELVNTRICQALNELSEWPAAPGENVPELGRSDQRAKISANEWNRRRLGALAKLRELQLAIAQGELVEVAKVEADWTRIAIQFRQAVMGIPGRIVNRIPAEFRSLRCCGPLKTRRARCWSC